MDSNTISIKKVGLPNKEWQMLLKKGYKIPPGNFSMVHVIQTLNHTEMMKHLSIDQKLNLLETLYSNFGLALLPLPEGFYLEIFDQEKLKPLIAFLESQKQDQTLTETQNYVQKNVEQGKGAFITIN